MSLFKAREWWGTKCGTNEEFDQGCLCIIPSSDGEDDGATIATGSFSGVLRIYRPAGRSFVPEDLLLEQELDQAILQLEYGRFSSSGGEQLAILHPHTLAVYNLVSSGSSYMELQRLYEHRLDRTAANFVAGGFGGTRGADFLCVQSYDGQLSFYEQEVFAFSRFLPGFLVPGPLAYLPKADLFITCSASFHLEAYRYSALAAAAPQQHAASEDAPDTSSEGKRVRQEWTVVLGEAAVQILPARFTSGLPEDEVEVVVIGEHMLFAMSQRGELRLQRQLEYHPAAATAFPVPRSEDRPGAAEENLIVATHTGMLLVYHNTNLVWSAKAPEPPVAVRVAQFGPLQGLVVSLTDEGQLLVNYMGTEPATGVVSMADTRDPDYAAMELEHRRLLGIIRQSSLSSSSSTMKPADSLQLRAQVPTMPDQDAAEDEHLGSLARTRPTLTPSVTARIYVSNHSSSAVDAVTVTATAPEPVSIEEDSVVIPAMAGGRTTPVILPFTFKSGSSCLPVNNCAVVSTCHLSPKGEPRCSSLNVQLPLCLFCRVVPPLKNAGIKLTVETNREPVQLNVLFEDVIAATPGGEQIRNSGQSAMVLSFQYGSGHDATILVSKANSKYRLQSDTLPALWLIFRELCQRLSLYFEAADRGVRAEPLQISLPQEDASSWLQACFRPVDAHFEARQRVKDLRAKLDDLGMQYRAVQKRLLVRFKDRNPAPLAQLDRLMEDTYSELMTMADRMAEAQQAQRRAAVDLTCSMRLLLDILRYKFELTEAAWKVLEDHLSPEVLETREVGWEEMTEAGATLLLRTVLAKNSREAAAAITTLTPMNDTSKLKKHIEIVVERVAKGMPLLESAAATLGKAVSGGFGTGDAVKDNRGSGGTLVAAA